MEDYLKFNVKLVDITYYLTVPGTTALYLVSKEWIPILNNINQATVPYNPFDNCVSQFFSQRLTYCRALGEAALLLLAVEEQTDTDTGCFWELFKALCPFSTSFNSISRSWCQSAFALKELRNFEE